MLSSTPRSVLLQPAGHPHRWKRQGCNSSCVLRCGATRSLAQSTLGGLRDQRCRLSVAKELHSATCLLLLGVVVCCCLCLRIPRSDTRPPLHAALSLLVLLRLAATVLGQRRAGRSVPVSGRRLLSSAAASLLPSLARQPKPLPHIASERPRVHEVACHRTGTVHNSQHIRTSVSKKAVCCMRSVPAAATCTVACVWLGCVQ